MSQQNAGIPTQPTGTGGQPRRWVKPTLIVLGLAVVVLCLAAEYIVRNAEPILRASVVDRLSARFHSPVQLDHLDISLARGLEVRGSGLRILYLAGPTQPDKAQIQHRNDGANGLAAPMLSVRQFSFRISLHELLHWRARVARVYVEGVELHIPPQSLNGPIAGPDEQRYGRQPRIAFVVGTILCRNLKLTIDMAEPGKKPLTLDVPSVQLTNAGASRPMLYVADAVNPQPVGNIHAFGHFGPWQGADPRATPLDGTYTFQDAKLGTIKGLGGTLSSTGRFAGQLGHIAIEGTANTPDFSLDVSEHPEPLSTSFQAFVDGTTGDTTLTQVEARLNDSAFTASGTVKRVPWGNGGVGHDIAVVMNMSNGRIQDLLELGMTTSPPVMRGVVSMQGKLHIPPGDVRVAGKMQLVGKLAIRDVEFSNSKLQDRVDGLSMRAQGKPRQVRAAETDSRAEVASQMEADFSLSNAMMTVSSLRFQVPGAVALLDGVYSLDGNVFEFRGHVRTQATASQMVSGWKSWLLKPIDPFLEKNGAGVELPVSINGTHGDVNLGLALHGADDSTAAIAADLKQRSPRTREDEAAKALIQKANREDIEAAKEKDLAKAEKIHNQAVRDRAEAQRDAAAASPEAAPGHAPATASPRP